MAESEAIRVGEWTVLPLEGRLVCGAEIVRLRPKAMDVLMVLAELPGQVVERDTLLGRVWGRTAVTDEPLTAAVAELRRALGDSRQEPRYIETIPKRGYRLLATVDQAAVPAAAEPPAVEAAPPRADSRRRQMVAGLALVTLLAALAILFRLERSAVEPPGPSVAVLPFATAAGDAEHRYFAVGLADEMRTLFTQIGDLSVAAPASVARFEARRGDLAAMHAELGVDTVLDGRIRRDGERVRITAQLVDTRSGFQLWAASYDRRLEDVFDVQSDIAGAIVAKLEVELLGPERLALARHRADNAEAYDLYLRGRYAEDERSEAGLRRAIEHYGAALELAPEFALGHAALGQAWVQMADWSFVPIDEGYDRARAAAQEALRLEADLAEAHWLLGWMSMYGERDLTAAETHYARALALQPGNVHFLYSNAALDHSLGNSDQALALARRAVALDPLNPSALYNLGYFAFAAGHFDETEDTVRRALALEPGFIGAHLLLAQVHLARGEAGAAVREAAHEPHPILALMARAMTAHSAGEHEASDTALAELESRYHEHAPYQIADVHAWRGDAGAAMTWLERALELNDPGVLDMRMDPLLDSLRDRRDFHELLGRAGLGEASSARTAG